MRKLITIFAIPELRRKILITLLFLVIYRIGYSVPLPMVDQTKLAKKMAESSTGAYGQLLGLVSTFSGGNLSNACIFAMGIMPYISASIILQLLAASGLSPYLEKLRKEPNGQKKINEYTRYLTIPITVIQATVAETTRVTAGCGGLSTAAPVTIMGTIAGLSSTQTAQVDIGGKSAAPTAAAPTFSISLPPGTFDLFARRMTAAPVWDRMIRRNGVTVTMGATFNLDFATDGFAPETHTITFQNVSATETTVSFIAVPLSPGSSLWPSRLRT